MKKNPSIQYFWYLAILLTCVVYFLTYKYDHEHPKLEWDTSPGNVVISHEKFAELDYGYIPPFRVWGDGRIVWTDYDLDYTRRVYQRYLSQTELKEIIEQFEGAGFYDLSVKQDDYFETVRINLLKRYEESSILANKKISLLVNYLSEGAGAKAKEFKPTVGYLYAFPIEKTAYFNYKGTPVQWPKDKYKVIFENYKESFPDGQKITGDELDFVWQIVNRSSIVEANGKVYWIALIIPKITH